MEAEEEIKAFSFLGGLLFFWLFVIVREHGIDHIHGSTFISILMLD